MKTLATAIACAAFAAASFGQLTYIAGTQTSSGYAQGTCGGVEAHNSYSDAAPDPLQSWAPPPRSIVGNPPGSTGSVQTTWTSLLEPSHLSWQAATPQARVSPCQFGDATILFDKRFDVAFTVGVPTTVRIAATLHRVTGGWSIGIPFSISFGRQGEAPLYSSASTNNPLTFDGGFSGENVVLLPGTYQVIGQNHTSWSGGWHGAANISDTMSFDLTVTGTSSTIVSQPQDRAAPAGQPATFTVQAYGSNPVYQWRHNGATLSDGGEFSGTHTATLTINPALATDAGTYDVDVTTSAGHDVSRAASLTITTIFTSQPQQVVSAAGQSASFSVEVVATNPQFQWRRNGVALTDDGRVRGTRTTTLTINPLVTTDEGTYDVYVTTPAVNELSLGATLTVGCGPFTIAAQPAPLRLNQCQTAVLSIDLNGETANYQWRRNGLNLSDGPRISGARTRQLTIHPIGPSLSGNYDVLFANSCSSGQSSVAVVEVGSPADFDGDTDVGTDYDIEAFFRCLAGNCCGTCYHIDFDGDGDVGTDRDIEAFFRALAGGGC